MKNRVLYITNKEVPYRNEFFNILMKKTDLEVLIESDDPQKRNKNWAKSVKSNYNKRFLKEIKIGKHSFKFGILKYLFSSKYKIKIFGCYNSKIETIGIIMTKIFHIKHYINIDGEYFFDEKGLKGCIKRWLVRGASGLFIAGSTETEKIRSIFSKINCYTYNFSSLRDTEIKENAEKRSKSRKDYMLIIGRYEYVKGLDLVLQISKMLPEQKFIFVGLNEKSKDFTEVIQNEEIRNAKVIPFLNKEELNKMINECKCLLLPSRKECWGLVINEAASFGTPIISTYGSGAATEFLNPKYKKLLAKSNDKEDLKEKIEVFLNFSSKEIEEYSEYLINKSKDYSIEKMVDQHNHYFKQIIKEGNKNGKT